MASGETIEVNPFKVAIEAEKKAGKGQNILHQKLAAREQEVRQVSDKLRAADRQIKSLNQQLSDQKRAYREVSTQLEEIKDKQASAPLSSGSQTAIVDGVQTSSQAQDASINLEGPSLASQHEALAARMLEEGLEKLDGATLAAAASGLRDTAVLEKQLHRARLEIERLQKEIQHLNDTVFSKTFKAPSAWADREVKYKMEKRSWEVDLQALKDEVRTLQMENEDYRSANRAAEFEEKLQAMQAEIKQSQDERVAAQQALHELQLQMREVSVAAAQDSFQKSGRRDSLVSSRVLDMEDSTPVQSLASRLTNGAASLHSRSSSAELASSPSSVQDTASALEGQKIGLRTPVQRKKSLLSKSSKKNVGTPDARYGDASDLSSSDVDIDALSANFEGRPQHKREGSRLSASDRLHNSDAAADRAAYATTPLPMQGHSKDDSATPDVSHSDRLEDHHARVGSVSGAVLAHAEGEPHSGLPRTNKPRTEIADFNKDQSSSHLGQEGKSNLDQDSRDIHAPSGTVRSAVLSLPEDRPSQQNSENNKSKPSKGDIADTHHSTAISDQHAAPGTVSEAVIQFPEGNISSKDQGHSNQRQDGIAGNQSTLQNQQGAEDDSELSQSSQNQSAESSSKELGKEPLSSSPLQRKHADSDKDAPEHAHVDSEILDSTSRDPDGAEQSLYSVQAGNVQQLDGIAGRERLSNNSGKMGNISDSATRDLGGSQTEPSLTVLESEKHNKVDPRTESINPGAQTPEDQTLDSGASQRLIRSGSVVEKSSETSEEAVSLHDSDLQQQSDPEYNPEIQSLPNKGATEISGLSIKEEGRESSQSPQDIEKAQDLSGKKDGISTDTSDTEAYKTEEANFAQNGKVEGQEENKEGEETDRDGSKNKPSSAEKPTRTGRSLTDEIQPDYDPDDAPRQNQKTFVSEEEAKGKSSGLLSSSTIQSEKRKAEGHLDFDLPQALEASPPKDVNNESPNFETPVNAFLVGARDVEKGFSPIQEDSSQRHPLEDAGHLSLTPQTSAALKSDLSQQSTPLDPELARSRALMASGSRSADDNMLIKASTGDDSPWTEEKRQALEAEKKAVEAELQEHLADQDVTALRRRTVEMATRIQTHDNQIQKMQKALEKADQEKAKLEEDLEVAMQVAKRRGVSDEEDLDAIRERMREAASQAEASSKETEVALQEAYRENSQLQRANGELRKQLGSIATKLGAGMIPDESDLQLSSAQENGASGTLEGNGAQKSVRALSKVGSGRGALKSYSSNFASTIGALSEEEIEVMSLRDENEKLMDVLVQTKVELAESQGDYLKMRRALIRAVEKQASLTETLDSVKEAAGHGDTSNILRVIGQYEGSQKASAGDIQSLGDNVSY